MTDCPLAKDRGSMPMKGDIVHYKMNAQDCEIIKARALLQAGVPNTIQLPNLPWTGDVLPMVITATYPHSAESDLVSGKILLNYHYPDYWAGSVREGDKEREWHWPGIRQGTPPVPCCG